MKDRARYLHRLYDAPKASITLAAFKDAVNRRRLYEEALLATHQAALLDQQCLTNAGPAAAALGPEPAEDRMQVQAGVGTAGPVAEEGAVPTDATLGAAAEAGSQAERQADTEQRAKEEQHQQEVEARRAARLAERQQRRQAQEDAKARRHAERQRQQEEAQRSHARQVEQAVQQQVELEAAGSERSQHVQELEAQLKAMNECKHGLVLKLKQVLQSEETARQQAAALEALEEGEMLTSLPPHLLPGPQPFARYPPWDPPVASPSPALSPLPVSSLPPHLSLPGPAAQVPGGRHVPPAPTLGSGFGRKPHW
ncbi:hypothetical protein WJX72_010808 [[Myrmecia] bisecta]|uniref:Reticulocyte-binding protein 2-like a n=1 Tax=[Myrmecia] bisecta TaxID=41462 RepID=A0AAW1Q821_9CHLO